MLITWIILQLVEMKEPQVSSPRTQETLVTNPLVVMVRSSQVKFLVMTSMTTSKTPAVQDRFTMENAKYAVPPTVPSTIDFQTGKNLGNQHPHGPTE
jgi:hypothetical protein